MKGHRAQLALVAGEASGDAIAAPVVVRLREKRDLTPLAVGGEQLAAAGCDVRWPYELLAVHGFADALQRLPQLLRFRRTLLHTFLNEKVSHFLGVDAPDFNLGLAAKLRENGVRTAHLVSPSVWAWRRGRIARIAQAVELLFCLFPFEPACYAGTGLRAEYVGHPLADTIAMEPDRLAARACLGVAPQRPLLALLPGSRAGEWARLGAIFFAAAERVAQVVPELAVVVPTANALGDRWAEELAHQWSGRASLLIAPRGAHTALAAADVVLVASGTATLEAALFKRPMVIAYRVAPWQYRLLRRMAYLPWVGLPNILCGEAVVPELLQDEATPQRLAEAVLAWWDRPAEVARLAERFAELHRALRCNMAERTAALLAEWLEAEGSGG
jgi:lipid-A-disaccharide synthase